MPSSLGGGVGLRIIVEQSLGAHAQGRKRLEARLERGIIDRFGMELLIDPLLEAHLLDALDVAWPRAVAEAIERVQNGFVLGEFGDGQLAFELRVQRGRRG